MSCGPVLITAPPPDIIPSEGVYPWSLPLSLPPIPISLAECTKSKPFGICTYSTTGALRKIQLRKLTEAEAAPPKDAKK